MNTKMMELEVAATLNDLPEITKSLPLCGIKNIVVSFDKDTHTCTILIRAEKKSVMKFLKHFW